MHKAIEPTLALHTFQAGHSKSKKKKARKIKKNQEEKEKKENAPERSHGVRHCRSGIGTVGRFDDTAEQPNGYGRSPKLASCRSREARHAMTKRNSHALEGNRNKGTR